MKVLLNPSNLNKKTSMGAESHTPSFKARAELRLSQDFFSRVTAFEPEIAASKLQGVIDVFKILKKAAPSMGKKSDVFVLTDNNGMHLQSKWQEALELNHYTQKCKFNGRNIYSERCESIIDAMSSFNKDFMKNVVNRFLPKSKRLKILEKSGVHYGGFSSISWDSNVLLRFKYDANSKVVGSETKKLSLLTEQLKGLCTPAKKQVDLSPKNLL